MLTEPYKFHSALKGRGGVCQSNDKVDRKRYKNEHIVCFQHDASNMDIPEEFWRADVIYALIAWRAGYKKFTENTIAKNTSFAQYLLGIQNIIKALRVPSFIMCGKDILKTLQPHRVKEIYSEEYKEPYLFAIWNYSKPTPLTSKELKMNLSKEYETVLDFSCGYGMIANQFRKAILSDINTGCIDYIIKTYGLKPSE